MLLIEKIQELDFGTEMIYDIERLLIHDEVVKYTSKKKKILMK